MFCEHCGVKKEEDAKFCPHCGKETQSIFHTTSGTEIPVVVKSEIIESGDVFYSKEWRQKNSLISSFPIIDILVDENFLYLIELPSYYRSTMGFIFGLLLLSILGAAIGYSIGASSDQKKREWYRSAWVNTNNKITSLEFMNNLYKKIPLNEIKNIITLEKDKFVLNIDNQKIMFGRSQVEFDRLNEKIKNYVL